ncbi:hypothetical protein HQ535_08145, partial [bacterium]|nr:hypothetical protein [bacterium]
AGTAVATVALFAQQMLIALKATGRLAIVWLAGLAVAMAVLAVGAETEVIRVGRAFMIGEIVAMTGITIAVMQAARAAAVASEPRTR